MKQSYLSFILLFSVFLLFSCSCPQLEEGVITDKCYEPAREWTSTSYAPVGDMLVPVYSYNYDEHWVFIIEGEIDGKIVRQEIYTTKEIFEQYSEGDIYVIAEADDLKDECRKRKATEEEKEKVKK